MFCTWYSWCFNSPLLDHFIIKCRLFNRIKDSIYLVKRVDCVVGRLPPHDSSSQRKWKSKCLFYKELLKDASPLSVVEDNVMLALPCICDVIILSLTRQILKHFNKMRENSFLNSRMRHAYSMGLTTELLYKRILAQNFASLLVGDAGAPKWYRMSIIRG